MSNLIPINDLNLKIIDAIADERFSNTDLTCILVNIIDNVPSDALPHLAEQYHVTGNEGWLQVKTDDEKRSLIKQAIDIHKYKGTKYAILRVLEILNLNGIIQEWFEYNGNPFHFKMKITLNNQNYNSEVFKNLKNLVEEYKNVRSVLEELNIESQFHALPNWFSYIDAENEVMIG